ncbi:hypothetical protein OG2516_03478 [Oceanicola granulosus HTCC2516]|uniref:DUF4167 domain-containing protein n=1 Tax=Oceanicola granulosus (strain ATCC BAA-861 / DSM 15982 / KCTC 12143 / HTCC2516) TaxID=314256 RepID=Q2CAJ0_OCEGH|nr:DUF4167 domain-containing protein [Oceanicola granulosus]EAR49684.1 hypothetical protein OG2516_03478 [Oceanicola granulosus HTCC2516]
MFDSSGPDGKVRGTPQQIIDKYNQLHRDAQLAGDRVDAENFAQHAEHYTRMLAEATKEVDQKREEQERQNRERQAERDRERAERLKAQEQASNESGSGEQPDTSGGSDLVDTPEARNEPPQPKGDEPPAKKPRRSRARKKPADDGQSPGNPSPNDGQDSAPEAAE